MAALELQKARLKEFGEFAPEATLEVLVAWRWVEMATRGMHNQEKPWRYMIYDMIWYDMIWYDMIWYDWMFQWDIPSGELTVCYWEMIIEIVDLPIKNGDLPEVC